MMQAQRKRPRLSSQQHPRQSPSHHQHSSHHLPQHQQSPHHSKNFNQHNYNINSNTSNNNNHNHHNHHHHNHHQYKHNTSPKDSRLSRNPFSTRKFTVPATKSSSFGEPIINKVLTNASEKQHKIHISEDLKSRFHYDKPRPRDDVKITTNVEENVIMDKQHVIAKDDESKENEELVFGPHLEQSENKTKIEHVTVPSPTVDHDSPLPLKNLGNTCYENSIIQCLFGLDSFMEHFEVCMKDVRQFVVKSQDAKPLDYQSCKKDDNGSSITTETQDETTQLNPMSSNVTSEANDDTDIKQKTNLTTLPDSNNLPSKAKTITDDDVRYRIANAFDNLYKCYTRNRCKSSIEEKTDRSEQKEQTIDTNKSTSNDSQEIKTTESSRSNMQSLTGLSSTENHESIDEHRSKTTSPAPGSIAAPLDLVSTTNSNDEPSNPEIESRLEELKSAVGERSSQFNSTHQQDASEFFYHVIDSIQEFYQNLDRSKDEDNPVTKAFELELDYCIKCPKCQHSALSEPGKVRTLHLALPQVDESKNDYNSEPEGAPTPPNSDLGLDSPSPDNNEERTGNSEEKENHLALVTKDPITLFNNFQTAGPSNTESTNTMSVANISLVDKSSKMETGQIKTIQKTFTLDDALKNYFKEDTLECSCSQPGCDSRERLKSTIIKKLPQVLFMTLARYSYAGKKNLDEVEAPMELKISDNYATIANCQTTTQQQQQDQFPTEAKQSNPPTNDNREVTNQGTSSHDESRPTSNVDIEYQLVGVVCHLGSSLYAGHYTSYVYNPHNKSWYSCDDDSITQVKESEVRTDASKSGYCFFYAKKSCINMPRREFVVETSTTTNECQTNKVKDSESVQSKRDTRPSENDLTNDSVANSTVVLTPEASPQPSPLRLSPAPIDGSQEQISMDISNDDLAVDDCCKTDFLQTLSPTDSNMIFDRN